MSLDSEQTDVRICNRTGGLYSSRRFYKLHFHNLTPPTPLLWIWKGKCMPKIKFLPGYC
jgi:hypothetical protein